MLFSIGDKKNSENAAHNEDRLSSSGGCESVSLWRSVATCDNLLLSRIEESARRLVVQDVDG